MQPAVAQLVHRVAQSTLPRPSERRRIREKAGLSLREIGAALGVDAVTVLRWERGAQPRRDRALAYRELLDALEAAVA
jgi:transcriptional regulator with XRE-family HTH domain